MSRTPSLYLDRATGLHRLNPLTKAALALTALVSAAALPTLPAVGAVFLLVLVPLAVWGRVFASFVRSSFTSVTPFLISLLVIQGFFTPGERVLFSLGPFQYTMEGLLGALLFATRLLVGLGSALLLLMTTRLDHLLLGLTQRGLSPQIAYIAVTALQIVPHFQVRAQTILDAQRSRGLATEGRLLQRFASLRSLIVPLLLSSLLDTEKRAITLESRGFRRPGPKTSWTVLADSTAQRGLRWLCLVTSFVLVFVWLAFPALAA